MIVNWSLHEIEVLGTAGPRGTFWEVLTITRKKNSLMTIAMAAVSQNRSGLNVYTLRDSPW